MHTTTACRPSADVLNPVAPSDRQAGATGQFPPPRIRHADHCHRAPTAQRAAPRAPPIATWCFPLLSFTTGGSLPTWISGSCEYASWKIASRSDADAVLWASVARRPTTLPTTTRSSRQRPAVPAARSERATRHALGQRHRHRQRNALEKGGHMGHEPNLLLQLEGDLPARAVRKHPDEGLAACVSAEEHVRGVPPPKKKALATAHRSCMCPDKL